VRILVVEDEIKMAGLLRRGPVEEGYAVDVAGTGSDAAGLLRRSSPQTRAHELSELIDMRLTRARHNRSPSASGSVTWQRLAP
jgi:hypothetical protein